MTKQNNSTIYCNCCGQAIENINFPKKDYLKVEKSWGYFSKKDLEIHEFYICEECYNDIISKFKLPIKIKDNTEVL